LADRNSVADYHLAGDFHAPLTRQPFQTMNKETLAIDACGEPQASVFVIVVGSVFHALADARTTQVCFVMPSASDASF
jgi:hypothetical protein